MGADTSTRTHERTHVVADTSVSLDGLVAGANDSVEQPLGDGGAVLHDWLLNGETEFTGDVSRGHEGFFNLTGNNHDVVAEWFGSTGALVVGRRMYDLVGGWGGTYPLPGIPVFVLTHDPPATVPSGETKFEFVTDRVEEAIDRARAAVDDGNVGVGGASVIQQCLDAGLLDEIWIHLVPVVLGDGVRLFDHLDDGPPEVETTQVIESPGVTHLHFRVDEGGTTESDKP